MGLALVGLMNAIALGEVTQNNGHYTLFMVIQGHHFRYQSTARTATSYYFLLVNNTNLCSIS